jgi:hypothetical protein
MYFICCRRMESPRKHRRILVSSFGSNVKRGHVGRKPAISGHWRGLSDGHSNVGYDLQSAHRPIGRANAMFEGDCALTAWLAFRKKEIHYERGRSV